MKKTDNMKKCENIKNCKTMKKQNKEGNPETGIAFLADS